MSKKFLRTPYEPGVSLRWDIYHRQFRVEVTGMFEYPEDDSIYGTYKNKGTLIICETSTFTDAVNKLKIMYKANSWPFRDKDEDYYYDPDLGRDMGPINFYPMTVIIYDRHNRKVLGGELLNGGITWAHPITNETELYKMHKKFWDEGSGEHRWNDYETARQMWHKAGLLLLHVVDSKYQLHDEINANAFFSQDTIISWKSRFRGNA
ncbi:hypothetical protein [Xenorhabdus griffiniae]|uniref:Uncharacterized protein n=1 Tax=Xenorhabdus griffiniae TaxID=351672 RepID=A0ABY9XER3_9GAMM|nr:hypothetical protein [Xenorhabdus griffiniae]MBD1226026.1 hypothetical protein [Xenorhabdus griffiniae]MBE8585856.1 hypothetical protein [Xenorhabdus griffiniae]WMV71403.1 hypothetical protein QL128_14665 [Xenorhabdus griffiniae]WNH01079.1 hypothetical protein QL112_014670 [Xenorhabdus griffiniae]